MAPVAIIIIKLSSGSLLRVQSKFSVTPAAFNVACHEREQHHQ